MVFELFCNIWNHARYNYFPQVYVPPSCTEILSIYLSTLLDDWSKKGVWDFLLLQALTSLRWPLRANPSPWKHVPSPYKRVVIPWKSNFSVEYCRWSVAGSLFSVQICSFSVKIRSFFVETATSTWKRVAFMWKTIRWPEQGTSSP
jgi:hypothetical protein